MSLRVPPAHLFLAGLMAVHCARESTPVATVPSQLSGMEGRAEDAYDRALAGDTAAFSVAVDAIRAAWKILRPQATLDGASVGTIAAMDSAVSDLRTALATRQDGTHLARAANAVSARMEGLFALYSDPTPPAVLALDHLGREVVLDARAGNLDNAAAHADAIATTFGKLRTALVANGGERVASTYVANMAALRADLSAADAGKLEIDAAAGLELVDEIERVFSKAAAPGGGAARD